MDAKRFKLLRLAALAALIAGLVALGFATGLRQRLSLVHVRAMTEAAGPWGVALFIVVFCVGELIQVPSMLFIVAGIIVYGRLWGGVLGWVTAVLSVSFTFVVVRGIGGRALAEVKRPLMKRILAPLGTAPLRTIFLLRVFFQASPPVNYALALSAIPYRDYLIGSAMGLAIPVAVAALFLDPVLRFFALQP
jgi:uncharacterized membrane protein YdjX (TVP38/TMEM64 family)